MFRRSVLPAVVFLVALAILISLGSWQVRRLLWKQTLVARVEARIGEEPVDLRPAAEWAATGFVDDNEYRRVTLTGAFEPAGDAAGDFRRFYGYTLLPRPRGKLGGQGYWVLNLFHPESGGAIFINRGFVPRDGIGQEAPPPDGVVTVSGLVRRSSAGNSFTPPCDPDTVICYTVDVERAATLAGIADIAPFYIDLDSRFTSTGRGPQAGETRVRFANNHLQYALTWFGLAAALTGVFGAVLVARRRGRPPSGVTGSP